MKNKNRRAFDWEALFKYFKYISHDLSVRKISSLSGASYSSIFRLKKSNKIDLHNLILILDWSKSDINEFIKDEKSIISDDK